MSNEERCRHNLVLCSRCLVITDAAKRMTDTVNALICFTPWDTLARSCMAFRLDDGTTDGTFYPNRGVALAYNQLRPCCVFYFRNAIAGVNAKDMQIFLNIWREAYKNDRIAWVDSDSPDIIISTPSYEHMTGQRNQRGIKP